MSASATAEALTAFWRGDEAAAGEAPELGALRLELAADGAWLVANALVNLEWVARFIGKKDNPLPPE